MCRISSPPMTCSQSPPTSATCFRNLGSPSDSAALLDIVHLSVVYDDFCETLRNRIPPSLAITSPRLIESSTSEDSSARELPEPVKRLSCSVDPSATWTAYTRAY